MQHHERFDHDVDSTTATVAAEQITLSVANGSWVASFHGAALQRIQCLFGSGILPTPYLASTPAGVVLAAIQKLNPTSTVTVK